MIYFMNLITIDIGNSTVTGGLWKDRTLEVRKISTKELLSGEERTSWLIKNIEEFFKELRPPQIPLSGIIISSVVPSLTETFLSIAGHYSDRVLLMSYKLDTGLTYAIAEPEQTGTDRIAASTAAYQEFRSPLVVVDMGSATTLTVVARGGLYLGGAILPGINLMAKALSEGTARLPEIVPGKAPKPIGRETVSAINSGIIYGTAGAIERLKEEFEKELGYSLLLITTGGNAPLVEPYIRYDHRRPYLVLEGLRLIFERNVHA